MRYSFVISDLVQPVIYGDYRTKMDFLKTCEILPLCEKLSV
jgi:hypothetical protein